MKALLIGTIVLTFLIGTLPWLFTQLEKSRSQVQCMCVACTIGLLAGLLFLITCLIFFIDLKAGLHAIAMVCIGALAFAAIVSFFLQAQLTSNHD